MDAKLSKAQKVSMQERCIVIDSNDRPLGHLSKESCHRMENISRGLLHRAFSVFLFNTQGELLMQQRSSHKATFPDLWTNTCCSHPLASEPEEGGEGLMNGLAGVRKAAQRRLEHELGIPRATISEQDFCFLTRMQYCSESGEGSGWGEHEIDYILFAVADVELAPDVEEVREVKYVSADELKTMLADERTMFTPWFKLAAATMLFQWWGEWEESLASGWSEGRVESSVLQSEILRMC